MINIKKISVSIVLFNNDLNILKKTIKSVLESNIPIKLVLIDNSENDKLKCLSTEFDLFYFHNTTNAGFGSGHNLAIKKYCLDSKYHLILNPDITFEPDLLLELINYMESNNDVGILMPKILYPNGENQYLAKLSPSIIDLLIRRSTILQIFFKNTLKKYELSDYKYDKIIDVPFLSGCFLICRTDVFIKIGGFDENLFLYMEDVDLIRRFISFGNRAIIYPFAFAFHDHEFKKIKNLKTFKIFFKSAFYYFNKWGWIFDKHRRIINSNTLSQIN